MRMLNELVEYPLMKEVRGSDTTDDEQASFQSSQAFRVLSCKDTCFWGL